MPLSKWQNVIDYLCFKQATVNVHWQTFPQEYNTGQDIDEALGVAVSNLGHFRDASKVGENQFDKS